jgi:hypothetical protein
MTVEAKRRKAKGTAQLKRNDIWAVTAYFNPVGYRSRLANYKIFRDRLTLPLVTVELVHEGPFELVESDADILTQIRGGDVLWQKERLLSIALDSVPESCDKVVWIDCDVFFEPADPWLQVSKKLDKYVLVQPFREALDLPADWNGGGFGVPGAVPGRSVGYAVATGAPMDRVLVADPSGKRLPLWRSGFGFAFRREVIRQHDFYYGRVLGGNDRAMVCGALGQFEALVELHHMTARQEEHYAEWAEPFFETVGGRIGYVDATVRHLWHGRISDRRYSERHRDLKALGFDPYTDVALDTNGCLRWSSEKPRLHRLALEHFIGRKTTSDLLRRRLQIIGGFHS